MRFLAGRLVATALVLAVVAAPSAGQAETIKMGGTGAAIGTMRILADAYMTGHPGTTIEVLDSLGCGGGINYLFEVADTGIGMAPEDIPKALSPFGKIDGTLSRTYEGTGLGLPLTKALTELHGGLLEIQSVVDQGTTVRVRFPPARTGQRPPANRAVETGTG